MNTKTRTLLGDALPLWFVILSPLIGLAAGLGLAWLVSQF